MRNASRAIGAKTPEPLQGNLEATERKRRTYILCPQSSALNCGKTRTAMRTFACYLYVVASVSHCLATSAGLKNGFSISSPSRAVAITEPSSNVISQYVVPLTRRPSTSTYSTRFRYLHGGLVERPLGARSPEVSVCVLCYGHITYTVGQIGTATLLSVELGSAFLAPITAGGQSFEVVVDTGSSDTWFVLSNFTCEDPSSGQGLPQSQCYFAAYYTPSSTLHFIPDRNFNISYADGEMLNGGFGYENLTIAGISIPQQEIALVENAAWYGDGTSSGLMGLAYSYITNAYAGDNPSDDVPTQNIPYSDIFATMEADGLTSGLFSLALNRESTTGSSSGGYLAFGGIRDIPHDPVFVSTPIEIVAVNTATNTSIYEFYAIEITGWAITTSKATQFNTGPYENSLKQSLLATNTSAIVDSGTSLLYAPEEVAESLAAHFSPAAEFNDDYGVYTVSCTATIPIFGVAIGSKVFYVNSADLLIEEEPGLCVMGVQASSGGMNILGDAFLRNVLAVFDVGAAEMRFAAREFTGL